METNIRFTPDSAVIYIDVTSIEKDADPDSVFEAAVSALKSSKHFSGWIIFEGKIVDDFTTTFTAEFG